MPRPITAWIDPDALRANLAEARRRAGRRRVWAVAKADAYGHGIERAVRAFDGADGLAVLEVQEAERARAAGWRGPILLLEGVFDGADLARAAALGLTVVVHSDWQLELAERTVLPPGLAPVAAYLKVDTGMSRLGFDPAAVPAARARLAALPRLRLEMLMTHLANADAPTGAALAVERQVQALSASAPDWRGPSSLSNSAALFLHPDLGDAAVRPGIALYGASPAAGRPAAGLGLRAAMTLEARLIAVRELAAGAAVGYGSRWRAGRAGRIGVVACGYADGYPRSAPDGTPAWVAGRQVGLAGRVSMDMLCLDLGDADGARVGDPVELWGARVPIDTVAELAGTNGYELMCAVAARVPVRERAA